MCLAVPAKILHLIDDKHARVDFGGIEKEIDVSLIEAPKVNEWVIVHVGVALNKIDEIKALETLQMIHSIGEAQS